MVARRRKSKSSKGRRGTGGGERQPSKPMTPELLADIETWALEAAQTHDLELFDIDIATKGRWLMRVFVDRPGAFGPGEGVMVSECGDVSRYLEAYLDVDERMPQNYMLEVSSPGIERPLKKPRHVAQVIGQLVELTVREQVEQQNKVIGKLLSFEDDTLELERDDESTLRIAWDNVAKAKLKYDFSGVKGR